MKKKNFKVGDIVKHTMNLYKDNYEYVDGERRFVDRTIDKKEETLLIVGYDSKKFIVTPLGDYVHFNHRKYFTYGGFERCFNVLASYVNDCCTSVSS